MFTTMPATTVGRGIIGPDMTGRDMAGRDMAIGTTQQRWRIGMAKELPWHSARVRAACICVKA
jgi:hypothetical protein